MAAKVACQTEQNRVHVLGYYHGSNYLARNEAARTKIMLEQEHCCLDTHEYCHSDAPLLIGLNAHEVARATKYI
jgi:hypothetical protein